MNRKIGRPKGTPKTGGRQKGTPNKTTVEVREFARALFARPAVQARIIAMAEEGKLAPAVFVAYLQYAYGKVPETVQVAGRVTVKWAYD